jgi:hypothetical protein
MLIAKPKVTIHFSFNMRLSKLKLFLLPLFLIVWHTDIYAQLLENFSDGNFTSNPEWIGNTSQFIVSPELQLQSNGDTTSASNREIYLSTANESINNTQWEFFVNPKVSTSSNNRMDVFLTSDISTLTGDNKGYFVRIGGTPDEVALFRKDGTGIETYVIIGINSVINSSSTNPTKVKVTRTAAGLWTLFADYDGTGALYEIIGSANDVTYTQSAFAGVVVRYSSSNRQKYYADDFYIGPIIVDNTPPAVSSIKVLSSTTLELRFNENVSLTTAQATENYLANNNLGEPIGAFRSLTSFSRVTLTFAVPFVDGILNTLTVSAVEDLSGNDMNPQQIQFLYYRPQPLDLVINEIMADPDPSVLLPSVEFVEIFNRTPYPIDLENWMIEAGTNRKVIPAITIQPDSFMVLTGLSGEEFYFDSLAVVGITSFPALTNTGARLTLYSPDSTVISTVTYSDAWYGSTAKAGGGWSLEQKSPFKPCDGVSNWLAATASWGGTPGKRNSLYSSAIDQDKPTIQRVVVIASDTIRVFFNESILLASIGNLASYTISDGIGNPIFLQNYAPSYQSVKLALGAPLQAGTIYTISITTNLRDCADNPFDVASIGRFAIPETPEPNDIVLNEVLTNPYDVGVDFVEIYNRSNKVIDLAKIQLGKWDTLGDFPTDINVISVDGYLMFSGEYLVLTKDPADIKFRYFTSNPDGFITMSSFPTYNNDDGVVAISRVADQKLLDILEYDVSLHYTLVDNLDGVSLERINPDRPSSDKTNWNSAASTVGYATPGYRNSQFSSNPTSTVGTITIAPELFSPDGDGFDDNTTIAYAFDKPGFTGSLSIYDSNGRLVKQLIRNLLLGTKGEVSWNGETDEEEKARLGIYVVYFEAFDDLGNIVKLRKPCVVGGKLN